MTEDVNSLQNLVIEKESRIKNLESELHWLKRQMFGQKSEKLLSPDNLNLFGKQPEPTQETEKISYTRNKATKGHGRGEFPDHLEVKEQIIDIPEADKICSCCGNEKKCIGNDKSKKFEAVPATVFIKEIIRLKYACSNCPEEGVVQAKMPLQVIPGGNCGTSLINHVIISKFLNHTPLERQSQNFKLQGITIAPSTMMGWLVKFCEVMASLHELAKKEIKACRWIHTDDTKLPVKIKQKKGKIHKGYFWVYIGENENVVFEYTRSRSSEGPREFLKDFTGYLHADGYPGYNKLYDDGTIKECACWSHGRRYFFEAYDDGDARALRVLELCGRLFFIERHIKEKNFTNSQVKEIRNTLGKLITRQIKKWLDKNEFEILPDNKLGKAIRYMLNNWKAFQTYMEEGYLSMHNNLSEQQIRKIVLGRLNWIYCGSEKGAERSALIYSFICTCRLLEINPYEYLNDVLEKILVPGVNLAELTPIQWKKHNPPPV